MRYIIADIHGCYNEYINLLKKIKFTDKDTLYILGDVVDRGPEPIKILQDMMKRKNVVRFIGNHEFMMYTILKKLTVEITAENCENYLETDDILKYNQWIQNGGYNTAKQFSQLSQNEKANILNYLRNSSIYETIDYNNKEYILVHADLGEYSPDKALEDYELDELIDHRADYSKRYFQNANKYLITGHTPTLHSPDWEKAEVYEKNGHIAIDCGCVCGGRLAAYCIETGMATYVDGMKLK